MLVPLGVSGPCPDGATPSPSAAAVEHQSGVESPSRACDARRTLSGIWWRYEAGLEGEPVRFYYFHGDGTGLYRYGRVGLTNTHSFDYDVQGDTLVIDFRKTGEHHEIGFSLVPGREQGQSRDWLKLHDDPREAGPAQYFRESEQTVRAVDTAAPLGPAPAGHMWIDLRHYATGGQGFAMYQFRPAGIDGRGMGWFHRGDFDDWSTESLSYRIVGDRIELSMSLAGTRETTSFGVQADDEGARWLQLDTDPRDFWQRHRYLDMGPSFGVALAPFELAESSAP